MPVSEIIDKVTAICKAHGVKRLEEAIEEIDTLRKIDLFDYDSISNQFLLEDIRKYGKQILCWKEPF